MKVCRSPIFLLSGLAVRLSELTFWLSGLACWAGPSRASWASAELAPTEFYHGIAKPAAIDVVQE